jgi:hypothetical protein
MQTALPTLDSMGKPRYDLDMTELLGRAFTAASKLPEKEQDAIGALVLAELASEQRWDAAFAASSAPLSKIARAALCEFQAGKTRPMDADRDFTH